MKIERKGKAPQQFYCLYYELVGARPPPRLAWNDTGTMILLRYSIRTRYICTEGIMYSACAKVTACVSLGPVLPSDVCTVLCIHAHASPSHLSYAGGYQSVRVQNCSNAIGL